MQASPGAIKQVILARLRLRQERERQQLQLLEENEQFHETVRAKLHGLTDTPQFWNFTRCGNEDFFRTCRSCGDVHKFKYRCSIRWCPRCNWRLTEDRKKLIGLWASKIAQPKHLILTQRNFPVLTRKRIAEFIKALARMRRTKCFKAVKGGTVSIEVTNEGNGWHVHAHWLIDCRWLDMRLVSLKWGKLVGQNFAIVKIKDVRKEDYLREVCKYVVEGSELAKWPGPQILEFVLAIKGRRFFFPFGSLFHEQPAIRRALNAAKPPPPTCECGSSDFIYEDEMSTAVNEIRRMERHRH